MLTNKPSLITELRGAIQELLRQWREVSSQPILENLQIFHQKQREALPARNYNVRQLLSEALAILESMDQRQADVLRLRFLEGFTVLETAHKLKMAEQTVYLDQREGIDRLAAILQNMEKEAQHQHQERIYQRLETATYSELVGVDVHLEQVRTLLLANRAPWIIAVEGIGGIGKTAFAHHLLSVLIGQRSHADYAWITARLSNLDLGGGLRMLDRPALTAETLADGLVTQLGEDDPTALLLPADKKMNWLESLCKRHPHLIVIDNLETLLDVESLLPLLRRLSNPTKILLTSRLRLESEPGIHHFALPQLDEANSLLLIRQEARVSNLHHVATAQDSELRPIFEVLGGNPLALRLLVGQLHTQNLEMVLDDVRDARGATVEALYNHIYRRSWERLNQITRDVWLCLPLLLGPAATAQALAQISQHSLAEVRSALDILARFNLIDCHGEINHRYYTLHSLTRAFLQKQVAQWE